MESGTIRHYNPEVVTPRADSQLPVGVALAVERASGGAGDYAADDYVIPSDIDRINQGLFPLPKGMTYGGKL